MPWLTMPIAAVIGTGAAVGTTIYGNKKAGQAADRASRTEQQTYAQQMAWERELEDRRREEFDRLEAERQAQWEADQRRRDDETAYDRSERARDRALTEQQIAEERARYEKTEARREPYRQYGRGALDQLGMAMGVRLTPSGGVEASAPAPMPKAGSGASLSDLVFGSRRAA